MGPPAIQYFFSEIYDLYKNTPTYVLYLEAVIFLAVIWLVFQKKPRKKANKKEISEEELEKLLEKWTPEPLIQDVAESDAALKQTERFVIGRVGKRINLNGVDCLNLGSHNYLGLLENQDIIDSSIQSLKKYGVGSCGPRGFYGTLDVHLELEERLAKFMEQEEAVVYSYGFSTIASAIPAYSKRGDVIFVDEAVNFSIQKGLDASRSKIVYFKHNDMQDLESKLIEQAQEDAKNLKKASKIRRFLVAEGIYANTGELCPLRELVELRKKYKLRMFLDESISFGVLGNGRGILAHLGVDKIEVDLITGSLEHSISAIGGFCVGTHFIVEHQRLSGLGYCFSASLPPLLAQASISALDKFESDPQMFTELQNVCASVQKKFNTLTHFNLRGDILSPIKHLYLKNQKTQQEENELLQEIVNKCIDNRLAIVKSEYLEKLEKFCPRPSIRLALNRLLKDADINEAFTTLERISKVVLRN